MKVLKVLNVLLRFPPPGLSDDGRNGVRDSTQMEILPQDNQQHS
jgi:hypothetical protein